jgi:response regulator RpfG family c-di-GMP phosphodiesterase
MSAVQPKNAKKGRTERFRVLIVDNHPMSREGLAYLINHQFYMTVCAELGERKSGAACPL